MPRDRRCITASIRRRRVAAEFPSYLQERGENAATRELMAMLASGSAEEREAATDWLMNSDPEALPAIEAAAAAMGEGSGGAVAKRNVQTLRPLGAKRAALEARRRDDETWNLREGLESF